ncbi:MAG TPA: hypothetical protein VN808_09955, partial [Stellaceae bacterium]|nr:hypothetical protein [Stellaceae bacterium]
GHLAKLLERHVAEDVAVEVHGTALPTGLGIELRRALHEPLASIGDDELHALKPALSKVLEVLIGME